ncbi:hypothetical protein [Nocardia goodfellowii]|uniref:Uncharacterized protein n=1 Tax=Nocardia goodfellowii TaxID=882446 RepID=A0ABS4QD93_9NOCA|nr:hypothetical protein [Nocardia goodfellowii]MBP2189651.1 hypothetical protein [Nocardia goodfellowii]
MLTFWLSPAAVAIGYPALAINLLTETLRMAVTETTAPSKTPSAPLEGSKNHKTVRNIVKLKKLFAVVVAGSALTFGSITGVAAISPAVANATADDGCAVMGITEDGKFLVERCNGELVYTQVD